MKESVCKNLRWKYTDAVFFTAFEGYDPTGSLQTDMAALACFSCAALRITAEIARKRKSEEVQN